jgi:hypothetical protein
MHRRALLGLSSSVLLPPCAWAQGLDPTRAAPPELAGLQLQGQARMRFLGLLIYDIRLWVETRVDARNWPEHALALELEYARSLSGADIAKRSLKEMRRQGDIEAAVAERWLWEMQQSFPDVKAGDRLSGRLLPARGAQFYVNGQRGRLVAERGFARQFFGIWLSEHSSELALRSALLEGQDGRG